LLRCSIGWGINKNSCTLIPSSEHKLSLNEAYKCDYKSSRTTICHLTKQGTMTSAVGKVLIGRFRNITPNHSTKKHIKSHAFSFSFHWHSMNTTTEDISISLLLMKRRLELLSRCEAYSREMRQPIHPSRPAIIIDPSSCTDPRPRQRYRRRSAHRQRPHCRRGSGRSLSRQCSSSTVRTPRIGGSRRR
jgi:hypothetical protein